VSCYAVKPRRRPRRRRQVGNDDDDDDDDDNAKPAAFRVCINADD